MQGRYFIDTNVFVYALDDREPRKQRIATELIERGIATASAFTSTQVAVEFANVATRPREPQIPSDVATRFLEATIGAMVEKETVLDDIVEAHLLCRRNSLSFFDALIITSASKLACEVVVSEDMQHGQSFGGVLIVNPFLEEQPLP